MKIVKLFKECYRSQDGRLRVYFSCKDRRFATKSAVIYPNNSQTNCCIQFILMIFDCSRNSPPFSKTKYLFTYDFQFKKRKIRLYFQFRQSRQSRDWILSHLIGWLAKFEYLNFVTVFFELYSNMNLLLSRWYSESLSKVT